MKYSKCVHKTSRHCQQFLTADQFKLLQGLMKREGADTVSCCWVKSCRRQAAQLKWPTPFTVSCRQTRAHCRIESDFSCTQNDGTRPINSSFCCPRILWPEVLTLICCYHQHTTGVAKSTKTEIFEITTLTDCGIKQFRSPFLACGTVWWQKLIYASNKKWEGSDIILPNKDHS